MCRENLEDAIEKLQSFVDAAALAVQPIEEDPDKKKKLAKQCASTIVIIPFVPIILASISACAALCLVHIATVYGSSLLLYSDGKHPVLCNIISMCIPGKQDVQSRLICYTLSMGGSGLGILPSGMMSCRDL